METHKQVLKKGITAANGHVDFCIVVSFITSDKWFGKKWLNL
jgi:hypothetical protein